MPTSPRPTKRRPGNPPTSKWRSTPEADRGTTTVKLTLDPSAAAVLAEESERTGESRSAIVSSLVLEAFGKSTGR